MKVNGKTPEMWAVAEALLDVAPTGHSFKRPGETHKSGFLPLSTQLGKGTAHKNAVSVHPKFVSFMVGNWTIEPSVQTAGFKTDQSIRYGKRLHVHGLTPSEITAHRELFKQILAAAEIESHERQKTHPRTNTK